MCTEPTQPVRSLHVDITQCSCCDRAIRSHPMAAITPAMIPSQLCRTAVTLERHSVGELGERIVVVLTVRSGCVAVVGESLGGPIELMSRGVHRATDLSVSHQSVHVLRPPPPLIHAQAAPHATTSTSHFLPYKAVHHRQPQSRALQTDQHLPLLASFRDKYGHQRESSGHTLHHHPHT